MNKRPTPYTNTLRLIIMNKQSYNISYYSQELADLWNDNGTAIKDKYVELYRIFNEILAEGTTNNKIEFASPFARFTYISQQKGLSRTLNAQINGMRSRCKDMKKMTEGEANRCFPYDVKSVVELLLALCGEENEKNELKTLYGKMPAGNITERRGKVEKEVVRVSVTDWDENFIYGETDDSMQDEPIKICVNDDKNYYGDWSYIIKLLEVGKQNGFEEGVQLNLIRPRFLEGVHYPEIIIYQPDFLIDISSIASCFEQYGVSPYMHLLAKLKENVSSKAILLGNFASQMLDEEVNGVGDKIEYSDSIMTFFRHNAMKVVACKDDMSSFHKEAQEQQTNIRHIVNTALEEDNMLDLDKVLLEPSFFCETLGIQGRMDLLHSDYKVLMEQKSGKRDFFTNGHVEKHYVQVLLYMALLHYSFNMHNDEISCFLLYSKYANGLLKESPAPQLLFEALKIRNQITINEFLFANGGIKALDKLTPEHIHTRKKENDKLWNVYKYPEIKEQLDTIQHATPLERAYFYRMFQFVEKEHVLSKCGTAQREGSGMASIWNSTIEEKKLAGNIFDELVIIDNDKLVEDAKGEGITAITLRIPMTEDDYLPNFRIGDIVILYKYKKDETPDARKGIVFRTNIEEIKDDKITVRLRAPQKNAVVFQQDEDTLWAIEHDFMESSFSSLYRSLFALLKARPNRRSLILGQRKPEVDKTVELHNDYSLGGKSPMFNELVLKAMQAQDYFIVIGPPGTGKTSFGMLNILKETLTYPDNSALLLSYTNRAVDEICSKLVKDGIDFIRIGSELSCPDTYKDYLLENKISKCSNAKEIKDMLISTRVFASTTTSLTSHNEIFALKQFSLAIIDEASQILEPHLMGILTAKYEERSAIKKFVFIGDHKQLPAVVQQSEEDSAVDDPLLNGIGLTDCRNSLFERLLRLQEDDTFVFRLNRQGRMHDEVALFPRQFFYEDNLGTVPMEHQHKELAFKEYDKEGYEKLLATHRTLFVDITPKDKQIVSYKVNQSEAENIATIAYSVWNLYKKNGRMFDNNSTIGIIVPYRHQIATVRHEIDKYGIEELHSITIDTVERYQGSERDVIIYGFTVQRPFQLDFLTNNVFVENGKLIDRKLNVAMTRAREQMVMVGNTKLLERNIIFKQLIDYMKERGDLV